MPSSASRPVLAVALTLLAAGLLALAMAWPAAALAAAGGLEAGSTKGTAASGGTGYGTRLRSLSRPTVRAFRVAPSRVVAGGRLPGVRVRFAQSGARSVTARLVLAPVGGKGTVVNARLGRVRTGRTLRPRWPSGTRLAPGRYTARVHAVSDAGRQLRRTRRASGRIRVTVVAPEPARAPAPPPAPAAAPVAPTGAAGTFPVAGPHTFGDGFGADRGSYNHQGVDILAAEGLANVAPTAGTIRVTDYQASGAGEYVVMRSVDGRDFFFAHCVRRSTVVSLGQAVAEGQPLCRLGSTGRSTAPHLHFEIWPNGWRTGARNSVPVDPLGQLRAWAR